MGTVGGKTCWELLVMLTFVLTVGLASLAAGQLPDHLKALCPAYPNCDNALLAEYDRIYKASLIHRGQLAHHVSKRQAPAAVPVTPGNIPGLVPGSAAAAQWWAAQLIHRGQLAHHVSKRQAPAAVPVTPGNIPGL